MATPVLRPRPSPVQRGSRCAPLLLCGLLAAWTPRIGLGQAGDSATPLVPISEATADRNADTIPDRIDQRVRVKGVVTMPSGTFSEDYLRIFIEDETGGIGVYDRVPRSIALGDVIEVEGRVEQFNGATQLARPRIEVAGRSDGIRPRELSVGEALSWGEQGRLVRVEGIVGQFRSGSRKLVPLRGDRGAIALFFPHKVGRSVSSTRLPAGARVSVAGVVSIYSPEPPHDNGFQVIVRDLEDVRVLSTPSLVRWIRLGVAGGAVAVVLGVVVFAQRVLSRRARTRRLATTVLNELSSTVADSSLGVQGVVDLGLRVLEAHALVDAALIHLVDRDGELRLGASVGLPQDATGALDDKGLGRQLRATVLDAAAPATLWDGWDVFGPVRREGLRLTACLPLNGRSRAVGVLCAFSRQRHPSATTTETFAAAARLIAMAVENIQMAERSEEDHLALKQLAITDDLTGLYNRRFLEEYCRIQVAIALRQGCPIGFLLADIDHFKPINDTFGHDVGDRVLMRVGEKLRETVRAGDLPVRYGGEEFLIVMPATDRTGALAFAERLRTEMAGLGFEDLGPLRALRITVSIGVAFYPEHGSQVATVLKAGDESLYRAKKEGRNRVVVAEASASKNRTS